jgi:ribonuclease HII
VILPLEPLIQGLNDSKKLSSAQRDTLEAEIYQHAVAWGLGWASPAEIDAVNILQATFLAMRRALQGLKVAPAQVLVDGNRLPPQEGLGFIASWEAVVRGDSREAAIAAASILAKTARDRYMQGAEQTYPGYGFAVHKGYGTARHMSALRRLGVTPLHRRTFEPVKSMVLLLPSES